MGARELTARAFAPRSFIGVQQHSEQGELRCLLRCMLCLVWCLADLPPSCTGYINPSSVTQPCVVGEQSRSVLSSQRATELTLLSRCLQLSTYFCSVWYCNGECLFVFLRFKRAEHFTDSPSTPALSLQKYKHMVRWSSSG